MSGFQYSKDHHYRWGWGADDQRWFNSKERPNQRWKITFGHTTRAHQGLREELKRAVEHLAGQVTKPMLVGLSGGYDSQAACLALMEAKVPFAPVIMRLQRPDGELYNSHDIEGAFEFCRRFNLTPQVDSLDLDAFLRTKALELSQRYRILNPRTVNQLYLVERYSRTHSFVMAGGDMVFSLWPRVFAGTAKETALLWSHGPTPIQQYLIDNEVEGCTKLFMYTPELIHAFIDNEPMRRFRAAASSLTAAYSSVDPKPGNLWQCFTLFVKPLFYIEAWPELIQRVKFTGFEHVDQVSEVAQGMWELNKHLYPNANKIFLTIDEIDNHLRGSVERIWYSDPQTLGPIMTSLAKR